MRLDATHVTVSKGKKPPRRDASVPLDLCGESPVSPKRNPDRVSHISADEAMPKLRARPSAEECKSKALHRVWYDFQRPDGDVLRFATWNDMLSEFSVDFEAMWSEVVSHELHARAALGSWRRSPCKRIGSVLPAGFLSWSDFLAQGGILDKTTGVGSLSARDKAHFWNDQCTCSPSCWHIPALDKPCAEPKAKRQRVPCSCEQTPCACNTLVTQTCDQELASLKSMRKLLPFGGKALDARIAELEMRTAQPRHVLLGAKLRADKVLGDERVALRLKAAEAEELARKCFSFWWTLEQQFLADVKHAPASSVELLKWFWEGHEEFVAAFRKRVGTAALKYL